MPFEIEPTEIPDVLVITTRRFDDTRGHFLETFRDSALAEHGIDLHIAQVNESVSRVRTLRGLHYQLDPHAQGKLVRVLRGSVLDIAVDLRAGSPWFGQHVSQELSAESGRMMWVPPGFAHGFCALSDGAHFLYMQSREYHPEAEAGIHPLDPALKIAWPFRADELILSEKDAVLPPLTEARHNFEFAS